jgi:proteasome alpha subunit
MDKEGFTVLGGQADAVMTVLEERYEAGLDLGAALRLGASVLAGPDGNALPADQLEVAILDRHRPRRAFRRIKADELTGLLAAS